MRRVCPRCQSHDIRVESPDAICNLCGTTVDTIIDGTWVFDSQPCNLKAEAHLYNVQYHRATTNYGPKAKTRIQESAHA